jgi:hypothetical protein
MTHGNRRGVGRIDRRKRHFQKLPARTATIPARMERGSPRSAPVTADVYRAELLPRCAGERIQQEKLIVPELGALPDLESAIPTTYVKGDGQFMPLTNHLAVRALQRHRRQSPSARATQQ